ncbi:MAG: hypothetical protein AAB336_01490, partial [Acidobacteriota bacterium]
YPLFTQSADLNNNQLDGVYETLKKAILTSADIQAASDENKQIACEVFAIRSSILEKQFSENPNLDESKSLAEQFINDLFRAYGKEFKDYQLTSSNFVKIGSNFPVNK